MSVCRYVKMSIFQNANFQLRYQKKSCSECQKDVRKHYVGMSTCRYVNMSVCQYGRMQLLSLGIKRKVGQNVNRMSAVRRDSERVRKSVRERERVGEREKAKEWKSERDVSMSENLYGQLKTGSCFSYFFDLFYTKSALLCFSYLRCWMKVLEVAGLIQFYYGFQSQQKSLHWWVWLGLVMWPTCYWMLIQSLPLTEIVEFFWRSTEL